MDILQDVTTLKEQGVSDSDLIDLLLLKGRSENEISEHLKEFYAKKNATIYVEKKENYTFLFSIIVGLLLIIAAILGWVILT